MHIPKKCNKIFHQFFSREPKFSQLQKKDVKIKLENMNHEKSLTCKVITLLYLFDLILPQ